ncbi:MAG: hypothetical protein U1F10_13780 [Burkholderiales bacterium]
MPPPELRPGRYLAATPAGAYLATQQPDDEPARRLLLALLAAESTPLLTPPALAAWCGLDDEAAGELFARLTKMALVESFASPRAPLPGALEKLLPGLLADVSGSGRALLADSQGFYLATAGFPHEAAEELSALSADLASLHDRHARLLRNNLALASSSWALVDAAGNSRIGFWPLFVGRQRFTLVIAGLPRLNHPAFVELVAALARRYATVSEAIPLGRRQA